MKRIVVALLAAALTLAASPPLRAQDAVGPVVPGVPTPPPPDSVSHGIRPIAVAKWSALALTVGAAAYGYHQNRLADSRYEELDRQCQAAPALCRERTPSGAYTDAGLEAAYQEVRRLDRRATVRLVGAELGVAVSVALFLLDLRHAARHPPNIPYTPPRLQLERTSVGALELHVRLPAP